MKVLSIWHGAVVAEYQKRYQVMSRAGMDTTLVVPRSWRQAMARPVRRERLPEAEFKIVDLRAWFPWHGAIFAYEGLSTALENNPCDILECIEEPFGLAALQVARWRRRRNSRLPFVVFSSQNLYKRYPWPFSAWERFVLQEADGLIGVNAEVVEVFKRKGYDGLTTVIPNGIDAHFYQPHRSAENAIGGSLNLTQDRIRVGYIGRLVSEKGVDTLIEAFEHLDNRFHLVIAGQGPEKVNLEQLANRLRVNERISWLPSLPNDKMPQFYNAMQIIVLPSRTRQNWKEQFGRVLAEAMACETNVIGSSSGEIPTTIGDAGLVFQEGDARDLARQIQYIADNETLARQLQTQGRRRALEHYSWETVASNLKDFFQQVIIRAQS